MSVSIPSLLTGPAQLPPTPGAVGSTSARHGSLAVGQSLTPRAVCGGYLNQSLPSSGRRVPPARGVFVRCLQPPREHARGRGESLCVLAMKAGRQDEDVLLRQGRRGDRGATAASASTALLG